MAYRKFNPKKYEKELDSIFKEILVLNKPSEKKLRKILSKYPKDGSKIFSKDNLIEGFKYLKKKGLIKKSSFLPAILQMKPTRSISGVTVVTVLTKPFACPGKCIFCPNDIRMPKSYIASEPGAQRALKNRFNPYLQVFNRLKALHQIGHPTDKIELLVLGGTWSYYPKSYQIWFIRECFRALNEFGDNIENSDLPDHQSNKHFDIDNDALNKELRKETGKEEYNDLIKTKRYNEEFGNYINQNNEKSTWEELFNEQEKNVSADSRCVGLVLETRPDTLNPRQVMDLRKLGATKIQIGVQTLDETVNIANKRMETKKQITRAFTLLRSAGFKIHAHMMPNLYLSSPEKDLESYIELFNSPSFKPDELKIYPTSTIAYTTLHKYYKQGKYKPYNLATLTNLLAECISITPEYCRLTRIIRDIPSQEISAGNRKTNLREIVESKLESEGKPNNNIRNREIRNQLVNIEDLKLDIIDYETDVSNEKFLQYVTEDNKIAGFLRLSLPKTKNNLITEELNDSAIIREVHVYGPSLKIGKDSKGQAQHIGLGTQLIKKAKEIAEEEDFSKLSVISAIGTKEYYRKKGFKDGIFYQHISLK